jgi:hypothetical protein
MNLFGYLRGIGVYVRGCLQLREDLCRECERPVDGMFNVCPHCGVAHPVRIPRCASLFIVGFSIHYVSLIVIQAIGS